MRGQLLNDKDDIVTEAIEGLCAVTPFLTRIDGFPQIKVVLDATFRGDNFVAVISGGGAGHEPAHAGFVGAGMLSAAAVGDVFASPPADAVLAAIRAVTGSRGCLLIVKNYTGDRLNFGLAAEQAKGLGLNVEMVVVGDDCALPGSGLAGRRGIAGTLFVHKIAGAASASGLSLEKIRAEAEAAAASVGSMGIATQSCCLPGSQQTPRLQRDEMEMGLGIHGEPGASKRRLAAVDEIVAEVVKTIVDYMKFSGSKDEFALLVNNLGGATCLEMGVITRAAVGNVTRKHGLKLARSYVGSLMTSLDMAGFSISLLKLSAARKQLLDSPTKANAWPVAEGLASDPAVMSPVPVPKTADGDRFSRPGTLSEFGEAAERAVTTAAAALDEASSMLDDWDQRVGDGDCGTTVARGAKAVESALADSMPLNTAGRLAKCLASCCRSMGGTSGAVYNIFFTAAAAKLPDEDAASVDQIARAFSEGVDAVSRYGGASEGQRTMLDALLPASRALQKASQAGENGAAAALAAAEAAEAGTEATKEMTAGAGRSSYVPESETRGIPDPGAMAVAIWLRAVANSLA